MLSKARIGQHPIHPMLVAFPVALYTATVAALLANIGTHDPFWYRAALTANIAGVVMALLAVIPGAIDLFLLRLPAATRKTGLKHAGLNLVGTGLFVACAIVLWYGWTGRTMVGGHYVLDATLPLAISVVGLLATTGAGMLGWSMVQTHHVGIVPRPSSAQAPAHPAEDLLDDDDFEYQPPPSAPHDTERNPAIH